MLQFKKYFKPIISKFNTMIITEEGIDCGFWMKTMDEERVNLEISNMERDIEETKERIEELKQALTFWKKEFKI